MPPHPHTHTHSGYALPIEQPYATTPTHTHSGYALPIEQPYATTPTHTVVMLYKHDQVIPIARGFACISHFQFAMCINYYGHKLALESAIASVLVPLLYHSLIQASDNVLFLTFSQLDL